MSRGGGGVIANLLGSAVSPLAAIATAPILAANLGVVGRGELAGATAPLLLAVSLASLGLPSAVNHWVARHPAHTRRVVGMSLVASVSVGILLTAAISAASRQIAGDSDLAGLVALAAVALVPNLVAALLQGVAAGRHAWRLIAAERVVTNGGRLAALTIAASTGSLTVEVAVLVIALSPITGALLYLPLLRQASTPTITATTREVFSYGGRIWFGALSGIVLTRLDQVLLAPLAGTAVLGVYAVAVSLSDIPSVVAAAVRDVTFSRQSAANDGAALARAARITGLAVVGACIVVAAPLPWLLPTLFGDGFAGAFPVTLVLLAGCAVSVPGSFAGVALSAAGRPGLRSISLGLAAAGNLVALIALAPAFGAFGAALATLAGTVVANSLNILFLRQVFSVSPRTLFGLRRADLLTLVSPCARMIASRRR